MEEKIYFSKELYYVKLNSSNGLIINDTSNNLFKMKSSSMLFILYENKNKQNKNFFLFSNLSQRQSSLLCNNNSGYITNPIIKPYESTIATIPTNLTQYLHEPLEADNFIIFKLEGFMPGPLFFQVCYKNENNEIAFTQPNWILVNPNTSKQYLNKSSPIKPLQIQIQTVLSKSLGKLKYWHNHLIEAKSLGFSHLHLTSTQQLGESNDYYSIKNHNEVNSFFFKNTHISSSKKSIKSSTSSRESLIVYIVLIYLLYLIG